MEKLPGTRRPPIWEIGRCRALIFAEDGFGPLPGGGYDWAHGKARLGVANRRGQEFGHWKTTEPLVQGKPTVHATGDTPGERASNWDPLHTSLCE